MANDITLPGTGAVVAADDVSSVWYQRVKLTDGTEGSTAAIGGSALFGLDTNLKALPTGMLDSFGKLQVVNCINDIDVQFFRDVPANLVTISGTGGTASSTTVPGLMRMSTGAGTTNDIKAVSLDNVMYRAGGEVFCLVTAAWLDGGVATSSQRIGLYDTNNGFFVGYEGTTFGITSRTGAADTQVAKASFNVDTLVGGATSRFTRAGTPEAINLALLNVFRIRFGWLGAAPIRFEVLSPDGEWVLFHVIKQPNSAATPSIQSVDLPITAHLVKTAGATDIRMNTACWGGGTTYDKVDVVGSNTLGTAANSAVKYVTQSIAMMQIRVGTSTTGTIIFEASVDGTNWVTHPACWLIGAAGVADTAVTAAVTPTSGNSYRVMCNGYRGLRVRTATTLGATVTLHANGENNPSVINVAQLPVSTNAIGNVGVIPRTTGGYTTYHLVSAGTTNATVVKNTAGQLFGWYIYNSNAAARKLAFHNASSTPTAGASIFFTIIVPPASAANVFSETGIAFGTGISITTVTDLTDAGTTAVAANDLNVNLWYV
jgi:hypothetical protein